MFRITKNETLNKTVRMPEPLIQRLEKVAKESGVSFNKVVVQCCEYALDCLPSEIEDSKKGDTEDTH